jgi:hypothetical protein
MNWDANKTLINDLWPKADITDAMNDLFAERLSGLDQTALAAAIKEARIGSKWPTPELGEILAAYHKERRIQPEEWKPKTRVNPIPPSPGVDPAEEQKTIRDIEVLRSTVEHTVEAVERLIEKILDAMCADRISSVATVRALVPLQALKLTLLGKQALPAAMEEAQRIWPWLAPATPEALAAPVTADEPEVEWSDPEWQTAL